MNIWDVMIVLALLAAVVLAARTVVRNKRQGRLSCGGDCARCMHDCEVRQR